MCDNSKLDEILEILKRIEKHLINNDNSNDEVRSIISQVANSSTNSLSSLVNSVPNSPKNIETVIDTNKKLIMAAKKTKEKVKKIERYIDFKVEHFDIDQYFVRKCMDMNSTNGDIQLFKKMYIDNVSKEYIPIRHIKKKFQYWMNEKMIDDDTNGDYIVNVVVKNIELCYMKVNNINNYENDFDQFLKNQEHIMRLQDPKYKERFLDMIIQLL